MSLPKTALFIQHASISHLNAGFPIAKFLEKKGYKICYFVHPKINFYIPTQYHAFYTTSIPIREKYNKEFLMEMGIKENYIARLCNNLTQKHIINRKTDLDAAVTINNPDVIVIDTFAALDFVLLYQILDFKKTKILYLETTLSPLEQKGVPYLTSKLFPDQKKKIYWESIIRKVSLEAGRFYRRILYFGYDNYSTVKRMIRLNSIASRFTFEIRNYYDLLLSQVETLATVPDELEFSIPQRPNRYVLGFLFNDYGGSKVLDEPKFLHIVQSVKRIIYVSFGTIFFSRKKEIIFAFLEKLKKAVSQIPNVVVVIAGGGSAIEYQDTYNMHFFKFVPQPDFLRYSTLFITHGGMNSIKESIYEEVPMLVYPLAMDQIGNARKIAYYKIGLLGDIIEDSSNQVKLKILELLNNKNYKIQVKKFKSNIKNYDPENIINMLVP